ncbi:hypothetical protein ACN3XK_74600 [Actinomadura welshii]
MSYTHRTPPTWPSGRGLLKVEAGATTWSGTGDAQGRTVRATFPRTALRVGGPEIG